MIGWVARFLLFLAGYLPMYLILAILGWSRFAYWSLVPTVIGLVSLVSIVLIHAYTKTTAPASLTVAEVTNKDGDVMPYLLGYLVPFIDLDFASNAKLWAMFIVFLSIGFTQVAANLIHVNPVILAMGRHIFEVKDSDGVEHTVLTREKRLKKGERLRVVTLADSFLHWTVKDDRKAGSAGTLRP